MIALALGGARCVWDDLAAAEALLAGRPRLVVACNDAGRDYQGRLDAWVTLHPEKFARWRRGRCGNSDYLAATRLSAQATPDAEVVPERWPATSGIYAAQVAIERMAADGVILCGVPMDAAEEHYHQPGSWDDAPRYWRSVLRAHAEVGDRIRSMSGKTRELFGIPNGEWLARHGL